MGSLSGLDDLDRQKSTAHPQLRRLAERAEVRSVDEPRDRLDLGGSELTFENIGLEPFGWVNDGLADDGLLFPMLTAITAVRQQEVALAYLVPVHRGFMHPKEE